jgi:hypothetical protein
MMVIASITIIPIYANGKNKIDAITIIPIGVNGRNKIDTILTTPIGVNGRRKIDAITIISISTLPFSQINICFVYHINSQCIK